MDEEETKTKAPEIRVGEDLALHSVEELERRIAVLAAEIERLRQAISDKRKSREAAQSVFKT